MKTVTRYQDILKTIEKNIRTDLTYDDMMTIISKYADAGKSVKSYVVQGEGRMINGSSYQVITGEEKEKSSNRIRKDLDLPKSKETFITGPYAPIVDTTPASRREDTDDNNDNTGNGNVTSGSVTQQYPTQQSDISDRQARAEMHRQKLRETKREPMRQVKQVQAVQTSTQVEQTVSEQAAPAQAQTATSNAPSANQN